MKEKKLKKRTCKNETCKKRFTPEHPQDEYCSLRCFREHWGIEEKK